MLKKFLLLVAVCVLLFCFVGCSGNNNDDYLRIHIRANSNVQIDQDVKYMVKNKVVDYLTPLLASATDKTQAKNIVLQNSDNICQIANEVLKTNGFDYKSNVVIKKENFPSRSYYGVVLEEGIYDAVIVNLGSGKGDNWWCVVYPPLCFVGGEVVTNNTITYKSKLLEIINNFFGTN